MTDKTVIQFPEATGRKLDRILGAMADIIEVIDREVATQATAEGAGKAVGEAVFARHDWSQDSLKGIAYKLVVKLQERWPEDGLAVCRGARAFIEAVEAHQ